MMQANSSMNATLQHICSLFEDGMSLGGKMIDACETEDVMLLSNLHEQRSTVFQEIQTLIEAGDVNLHLPQDGSDVTSSVESQIQRFMEQNERLQRLIIQSQQVVAEKGHELTKVDHASRAYARWDATRVMIEQQEEHLGGHQ